jgi:hypothetical protein
MWKSCRIAERAWVVRRGATAINMCCVPLAIPACGLVAGRWRESAAARGGVRLGVAAAGEVVAPKPGRELLVSTELESRGVVESTKKLSAPPAGGWSVR